MSDVEHLDVLIVGAGLSGVGAAHRLQTSSPWATYAIFEARDAIGGTWDLFRYPGIRSDSDMHTLGYSFRPWAGDKTIADGSSILAYIRETATEAGIDRRIRFAHRVVRAEWSSSEAWWHVTVERSDDHGGVETFDLTCSFLYSCTGYYRYDRGHLPDFEGMEDFTGQIVHPQFWPEDLDHTGRRVVVIGSGATAVTLVPAMAETAAHVTMLQRSPTYMGSVPTRNPVVRLIRRLLPARAAGVALRWINALATQGLYVASKKRPEAVRRMLLGRLASSLPEGYDVETHFTPRYDPWDQRLCAVTDGDLFRAIRRGSVTMVTDHVDRFTPTGIALRSGGHLDADLIVPATGLDLLFMGGIELFVDGEKVDPAQLLAYKGLMLEGVPNLAMAVGYTNASWTLKADLSAEYVSRLLNHMRAQRLRQATPVNHDASMGRSRLLDLSAGYIERSEDQFPKSGDRFPWQVYQSYLRDYRAMKVRGVVDEGMVLSNPVPPAPARGGARAAG